MDHSGALFFHAISYASMLTQFDYPDGGLMHTMPYVPMPAPFIQTNHPSEVFVESIPHAPMLVQPVAQDAFAYELDPIINPPQTPSPEPEREAEADQDFPTLGEANVMLSTQGTKAKLAPKPTHLDIIAQGANREGQSISLERGTDQKGLTHIMQEHGHRFLKMGILETGIANAVITAVTKGVIVSDRNTAYPIYQANIDGNKRWLAVKVVDGSIISAYPILDPHEIVAQGRKADGQAVFIKRGTVNSGLEHIMQAHGQDFVNMGIPRELIPSAVIEAVTKGTIVDSQGGRPIYEVTLNGWAVRIAVTVANNGYVVGANPTY